MVRQRAQALVMANCILVPSTRVLGVLSRIHMPDPFPAPVVPAKEHSAGQMGAFLNVLVLLSAPHPGTLIPESPLISGSKPLVPVM